MVTARACPFCGGRLLADRQAGVDLLVCLACGAGSLEADALGTLLLAGRDSRVGSEAGGPGARGSGPRGSTAGGPRAGGHGAGRPAAPPPEHGYPAHYPQDATGHPRATPPPFGPAWGLGPGDHPTSDAGGLLRGE